MKQEWIKVGEVDLPVVVDEGRVYYPISYLSEKVLQRSNSIISKKEKDQYKESLKTIKIDYGSKNVQKTVCIEEKGLIERLKRTQTGRLSKDQKIRQNKLHKYLGIELLNEKETVIKELPEKEIRKYDNYTLQIVNEFIEKNKACEFQLCESCEKYFPLDKKFFPVHSKATTGYTKICHVCLGRIDHFKSEDKEVNKLISQAGINLYNAYLNDEIHKVYDAYLKNKIKFLPDCYENKESYIKIIKYMYERKMINSQNLLISTLQKEYKLKNVHLYMTTNELHEELFGSNCKYYPWKYPNWKIGRVGHTFEEAKTILNNYIKENNVEINNLFNFKFGKLIADARITIRDTLGFIVYYYDYKYAGYKFKSNAGNYYKKDENVKFDLKYLIEEDMKIENNKIPLYLTKTSLREYASPLYNCIVLKKNKNLYYWVNELYPNLFTELDFDIHHYRDQFDSIDEARIHEVLTENLNNVIYNVRNTERSVSIMGMQPDWIIIGSEKCWFIEYFGMYTGRGGYNTRTDEYMKKTEEKMKKYEKLEWYGKVFLFPEDLNNNFEGVKNKIKIIK